ncbi:MAG TPA: hypothetical protein PKC18_11375, partial [Lacipirellulaceae bacterium]|nr:hypothetical protein [Lacipirellulaceae bacterium]
MTVLVGLDHQPLPPTWLPERLARIHPGLTVKWYGDPRTGGWGVRMAWQPGEPRMHLVHTQQMALG